MKGSIPRAKDTLLLPSAIPSVGLPEAQVKIKGAGEEGSSQHPAFSLLRAQRLPPRCWPSRGRQMNPKQVWLKLCPPLHPPGLLLAPKFCTTPLPPTQFSCLPKEAACLRPLPSPTFSLRHDDPSSLSGLSISVLTDASVPSCH